MKSYRAYLGEINDQLASIENIDDVSDADKKVLMNALLEKVEIFKEKQKDGR